MHLKSMVITTALFFISVTHVSFAKSNIASDTYEGTVVLVDRNCIDGKYILEEKEQFLEPNEFPSIQNLVNGYSSSNYMSFIYGVLEKRYPTGKSIIEQGGGQQAVDKWLWSKDNASSVLRSIGMVVHEIGHGIDQSNPENTYFIAVGNGGEDVEFSTPGMHGENTWSGSPMYSMARSLLLDDDQNYKRPPADSGEIITSNEFGEGPFGSDESYADTYLTGDPTDDNFDGGDQGYNSLMEEFTQYVNSLALEYYFMDYNDRASSDRHAMLTWCWWNERYLRKIRTEHPDQYEYLLNNQVWLDFVLTMWGRAWLYLRTEVEGMQPDTDYLHELVQQDVVLSEIQMLRDACGCDNPEELLTNMTGAIKGIDKPVNSKEITHFNVSNPINGNMSIVLEMKQKQKVLIDLYNSRGIKMKTLHNNDLGEGKHTFTWNGNSNANGVYFYRILTKGNLYKGKVVKYSK